MNNRKSVFAIAAAAAVSALALQAPIAGAADNKSASGQQGVPGVEMNLGKNANDGGLPGVEMNVGRDGDQNNIDTRTLGAGPDKSGTDMTMRSSDMNNSGDSGKAKRPLRRDRG